jgi:hypothetical protein
MIGVNMKQSPLRCQALLAKLCFADCHASFQRDLVVIYSCHILRSIERSVAHTLHFSDMTNLPLLLFQFITAIAAQVTRSPDDLSFFTKGAAIGDSSVDSISIVTIADLLSRYAAGIGAGAQLDFWFSRYDGSYAYLVASQLGTSIDALDFTYTACSGAVISEVKKQAEKLSPGQEFVIVSAVRCPHTMSSWSH